jgi:beta-phosphoglucomutase
MSNYKLGLLFDVDGVIVDSMPLHTEVWRIYMERAGIAVDDIAGRMHGKHNGELVLDFFGPDLSPQEVIGHGAAKEALYREIMGSRLQQLLVPGIVDFLARHARLPKAVGSNAEPANVNFVLDGADLRQYFEVIVDGMQVDRPKPYPDIYLRAADLLKVDVRNCVVFEDSPAGVAAGRAAGARVVGVETHAPLADVDFRIRDFQDPGLNAWLMDTTQ